MTVDQLIDRLAFIKGQIGGGCEVRLTEGDAEYDFAVTWHLIRDHRSESGVSNVVLIHPTIPAPSSERL